MRPENSLTQAFNLSPAVAEDQKYKELTPDLQVWVNEFLAEQERRFLYGYPSPIKPRGLFGVYCPETYS